MSSGASERIAEVVPLRRAAPSAEAGEAGRGTPAALTWTADRELRMTAGPAPLAATAGGLGDTTGWAGAAGVTGVAGTTGLAGFAGRSVAEAFGAGEAGAPAVAAHLAALAGEPA